MGKIFNHIVRGTKMKRLYMLLAVCLAFPVSVFALDTTSTDIVIESGIEEMMLQTPTG
jgi:hypothetical protein